MLDEEVQARLERIGKEALAWCEASVQDEDDMTEIMADDIPWMLDLIAEQAEALHPKSLKAKKPVKLSAWVLNDTNRWCVTLEGGDPNELKDQLAIAEDQRWVTWSGTGFNDDNKIERGSAATLQANQNAALAQLVAWGFVPNAPEETSDV